MALLLSIGLIENIGKHVIILDGERASLEIIFMTHKQSKEDVLNDQYDHQSNTGLGCSLVDYSIYWDKKVNLEFAIHGPSPVEAT